jgi:hypothetical protein
MSAPKSSELTDCRNLARLSRSFLWPPEHGTQPILTGSVLKRMILLQHSVDEPEKHVVQKRARLYMRPHIGTRATAFVC